MVVEVVGSCVGYVVGGVDIVEIEYFEVVVDMQVILGIVFVWNLFGQGVGLYVYGLDYGFCFDLLVVVECYVFGIYCCY